MSIDAEQCVSIHKVILFDCASKMNAPDSAEPRRDHLLEDVEPKFLYREPKGMELSPTSSTSQLTN